MIMKNIGGLILIVSLLSCETIDDHDYSNLEIVLDSEKVENEIGNLILDWRYGRLINSEDTLSSRQVLSFFNFNSNDPKLIDPVNRSYFYHVSTLRLSNGVLIPVIREVAQRHEFRLYGLIYDELDNKVKGRILLAEYSPNIIHTYSTIEEDVINTFYLRNSAISVSVDSIPVSVIKTTFEIREYGFRCIERSSSINDTLSDFPHESNWFKLFENSN